MAATSENIEHAKHVAADIAASKDAREAGAKFWSIWKKFRWAVVAKIVGRGLVCMYFMNLVYEDYESWHFFNQPEARARIRVQTASLPGFPWIGVVFLLPCAVLAMFGFKVPITATILVLDMLKESGSMITVQL